MFGTLYKFSVCTLDSFMCVCFFSYDKFCSIVVIYLTKIVHRFATFVYFVRVLGSNSGRVRSVSVQLVGR